MPPYSNVLYALEHSIEPLGFESLATDLLVREGYTKILPGGRIRDLGRDAEVRYWTGQYHTRPVVAFQFSMERSWEKKIRSDARKIKQHCPSVESIVFASNQSITIEKRDKIRAEMQKSLALELTIFDRDWFRLRLEEQHQDLAEKHLGIKIAPTPNFFASRIILSGLSDENSEEVLMGTSVDAVRSTFTAQLSKDPRSSLAWEGIAHVDFYSGNYDAAIMATEKAIDCSLNEIRIWNLKALKGAVLAEKGIQTKSKLLLVQAKNVLGEFLQKFGRFVDHFNYANVLDALGDLPDAEMHYRRCLEIRPEYAPCWKNLGSLLCKQGMHEEEIDCYDRALAIHPLLPEALLSKANTLAFKLGRFDESLECFAIAFGLIDSIAPKWRHAFYWYSRALFDVGRTEEALKIASDGMLRYPGCNYLLSLKSLIFSRLWREDSRFLDEAEKFYRLRVEATEEDYAGLFELVEILRHLGKPEAAWDWIDAAFPFENNSLSSVARRAGVPVEHFANAFKIQMDYSKYREISNLADYGELFHQAELKAHRNVPNLFYLLAMVSYAQFLAEAGTREAFDSVIQNPDKIASIVTTLAKLIAAIGGQLLSESPQLMPEASELLAKGMVLLPNVILIEASRQWGFLAGRLKVEKPEDLGGPLADAMGVIQGAVIEGLLSYTNKDWKLGFKQEE